MAGSDDLLPEDDDAIEQDYEEHRQELFELISAYGDDNEVGEHALALLLMDVAVTMRMVGYGMDVEKPSATGLKLELDRFQRDIGDLIRESKKNAEGFLEEAKQLREQLAEMDDEDDDEFDEDDEYVEADEADEKSEKDGTGKTDETDETGKKPG